MKSKAHYKRTSSVSTSDTNGETQASQCSSTPSDEDSDSDADNENDSGRTNFTCLCIQSMNTISDCKIEMSF